MTGLALHDLTVSEAARRIAAGTLSPVALVEATLDRIAAVDGAVRSTITVVADRARSAARAAEAEIAVSGPRGPLHGIPYGLKDNIFTAGVRTTANSRAMLDHVPDTNATVVGRLDAAGAILIAKLSTYEFGTGTGADSAVLAFPPARNPWALDHFTGGSSTGSGAAVAAGTALFAIGADTGGSIRLPAAACGLFGLKPTYGLVSRAGVLPNAWSLDHVGPLARTARDAALILSAIAGHDPRDSFSARAAADEHYASDDIAIAGLTIGVTRSLNDAAMDDASVQALEDAIACFRSLGARIMPVELPASRQDYIDCQRIINTSECFSLHQPAWLAYRQVMGPSLAEKLTNGACLSAADYLKAMRWRRALVAGLAGAIEDCDLLLSAAVATPAPRLDDPEAVADFTSRSGMSPFSLSGFPALAMPAGFSAAGLPLSVQLSGPAFADALLLRAAQAFDRATRWSDRRAAIGEAPAPLAPAAPMPPTADIEPHVAALALAAGIAAPTHADLAMLAAADARMRAHRARLPADLPLALEPALAWLQR